MTWNVFDQPPAAEPAAPRDDDRDLTRSVFSTPAGQAWLRRQLERCAHQPAYQPGDALDLVAWRSGRQALLLEIDRIMHSQES